jgi:hypothetical protein
MSYYEERYTPDQLERFWKAHFLDDRGKRRRLSIRALPEQQREDIERHVAALLVERGRDWRLLGIVEGKLLPA